MIYLEESSCGYTIRMTMVDGGSDVLAEVSGKGLVNQDVLLIKADW